MNHSLLSCDTRDWKEDGVLSECDAHGTHQSLRRSRSGIQPGRRNNSGHTLSEHQPPLTHLRVFPSTPNMWWFFQHQFSDSPTLSGYSTTQFNSDINYPEGLQTPQIKGWVPRGCPPPSYTSHKSQAATHASDWLALYKSRGSHNLPLSFSNLLEQLTEFRKSLYLHYWFIINDTVQEQTNRRNMWGQVWGPAQNFHVLSGYTTFQAPGCVHQPESSLNPRI